VLMLQGGGRSLEDLSELKNEEGLMKLIGCGRIPEPNTIRDWLKRMGDPKRGEAGLERTGSSEGLDQCKDFEKRGDQAIHVGCGCDGDYWGEGGCPVHL